MSHDFHFELHLHSCIVIANSSLSVGMPKSDAWNPPYEKLSVEALIVGRDGSYKEGWKTKGRQLVLCKGNKHSMFNL